MFNKYLILIGRTFIATFFIVNLFNIIPINLSNNAWFTQVSMLFVDTASLLLLGLVSLKVSNLLFLKKFENSIISDEENKNNISKENFENNLNLLNKSSKILMFVFIFLAILQFYTFFNGNNQINQRYILKYQDIENRYKIQKEKLNKDITNNMQDSFKDNKLETLNSKRNIYEKNLNKDVSMLRFLLLKVNIKVFLMSLIWAYGLYKLHKFNI
ncbi:hypothetical protein HA147_06840 [Prochlorococcus marinus XMU1410]|uniref:hypothetical protein n=1 Tax=Prochlorococcus marinus TaxID=1219 RepID=UPI001ADD18ED|nr:hypothetical protein [Prochlorococcus marinus]MBO8242365.1 hypothetical protein [Prochlorococcus marinus XMU1410]MBW3053513.1 hypothetical protein [Prochlorococcus marinus str. MU1410]